MYRKRKKKKLILIILPILILSMVIAFLLVSKYQFRIKHIEITGSDKYSYEELYNYIFENHNDENLILFKRSLKKNPMPEIPFIAKISVETIWPDTLKIEVYEKSIIGYILFQGAYMYFDKDGVIVESSNELLKDIPKINGLDYSHIVLYETLDVSDQRVFPEILDLKQYLEKYDIPVDEIYVSADYKYKIKIGNIDVLLGNDDSLMSDKIYELSCMMHEFGDKRGTLDMENYNGDSKYIILTEEK